MNSTFALVAGYSIDLSFDGGALYCTWSPCLPTGDMARLLMPHYRRARDTFLAEHFPLDIVVVEMGGDDGNA